MITTTEQPPQVLIAEDNRIQLDALERMLREAGWKVTATTDGRRAWELATNGQWDALLFDHRMPHMPGLEIVEKLRARGQNTVVVMLTNYATAEFRKKATEHKVSLVLSKPTPREFVALFERTVKRDGGRIPVRA